MTTLRDMDWQQVAYDYGEDTAERLLRHWQPVDDAGRWHKDEAESAVAEWIADASLRGPRSDEPSDLLRKWYEGKVESETEGDL